MRELGVADILEGEGRNARRRVTRHGAAVGRDDDDLAAPAAHAGLWCIGVVVGRDEVDDELPRQPGPRVGDDRDGGVELIPRRHQRGAVGERPAVILDMRDLDAAGAQFKRQFDEAPGIVNIGAVQRRVQREGQAEVDGPRRDVALALKSRIATDRVGGSGINVL